MFVVKNIDGESCTFSRGKPVKEWLTGDSECDSLSVEYECGGVYNHNYMDMFIITIIWIR